MAVVTGIKTSIWNFGALCFFVWFGFKVIGFGMDLFEIDVPSICVNTDVANFTSPDGKKIAKPCYSDYGATTNWQTGITSVDVETGKEVSVFFGLDGKPEDLKVVWQSGIQLTLSHFPIEKLLWFNQYYSSGVKVTIEATMDDRVLQPGHQVLPD